MISSDVTSHVTSDGSNHVTEQDYGWGERPPVETKDRTTLGRDRTGDSEGLYFLKLYILNNLCAFTMNYNCPERDIRTAFFKKNLLYAVSLGQSLHS